MAAVKDQAIIRLFEQRSEQAISESSRQYGALCRSVARNILGSDEDAEECLNDALLRVWQAIPPAKPENYCAYLLKLVRNAALDRCKARQRGKRGGGQLTQALDELTEIFPSAENIEHELEQRELMQAVTKYLQALPEKQRNLFICRYWQAEPVASLAKRFAMNENTVKVTLARLRKRLQAYLRKEGLL